MLASICAALSAVALIIPTLVSAEIFVRWSPNNPLGSQFFWDRYVACRPDEDTCYVVSDEQLQLIQSTIRGVRAPRYLKIEDGRVVVMTEEEKDAVDAVRLRPRAPLHLYVCGDETHVMWVWHTHFPLERVVRFRTCNPPFQIVIVPEESVPPQLDLAARLPGRHLRLTQGHMKEKSKEEKDVADEAHEQFIETKRAERAKFLRENP